MNARGADPGARPRTYRFRSTGEVVADAELRPRGPMLPPPKEASHIKPDPSVIVAFVETAFVERGYEQAELAKRVVRRYRADSEETQRARAALNAPGGRQLRPCQHSFPRRCQSRRQVSSCRKAGRRLAPCSAPSSRTVSDRLLPKNRRLTSSDFRSN
jgi:hypothetical protein